MSRRAMLTTILIALLLVAVPYTALATDSDGDGTDDADDDFPNNPCADTDTDGDGLPDTVVSGCSSQSVVGYTSFEDPFAASIKYTDTGSESVSRYLWNNAAESHVAHNQTTGAEMGFTLYYTSIGGVGLTDGDYFGTVNYTGTVGNFTDGTKGYQMSDVDGITTLALDDITAEILTFDLFVQDTGWEWSGSTSYDYINISFVGANSDISILSTYGTDIDTGYASYLGTWTTTTVAIGAAGNGHLEVEFSSNSGEEAIYLDNIEFTSTVVLTADLDDDGDGWLDSDEVDCGTDPLDNNDVPADADSNGICDALEGDDFDGDGIPNDQDPDDDNDGVDDVDDAFPLNANEWSDADGDSIGDNADQDDDNDGWTDDDEIGCGTDPLDGVSMPSDYDSDAICDSLDSDDDNDGADDVDDAFPYDETEWKDTDGDGIGDNADEDDDNDGWSDVDEDSCGSNARDPLSIPLDSDGDGTCDFQDLDADNDGVNDADDAFPLDESETTDTDGDGIGNNADGDDDGDGTDDVNDAFPLNPDEWAYADSILFQGSVSNGFTGLPISGGEFCVLEPVQEMNPCRTTDADGMAEWIWLHASETDFTSRFTLEGYTSMLYLRHYDEEIAAAWQEELESAGVVSLGYVAFTTSIMEWWMSGGGITMEEGAGHIFIIVNGVSSSVALDGITASFSDESGTVVYWGSDGSTLDSSLTVSSITGSFIVANVAPGTYTVSIEHENLVCNDGLTWMSDVPHEYTVPVEADTVTQAGVFCFYDSDGDGIGDDADQFPNDPLEWVDSDGDLIGDNGDAFPDDSSEWSDSDGDGIGDNADSDVDGDGWSDVSESDCGSDALDEGSVPADFDGDGQCDDLDPDDDGDGVADGDDASPNDPSEWDDTDGDGIGDNADLDDDNDGWSDAEEDECGTDQYDSDSTPVDYDSNGVCDANDPIVEPETKGTPGFGLLSALTVLALAAFARRD